MILRKITADKSVKQFAQNEQTQLASRGRGSKPETIKKKTSDKNFS